MSGPGGRSGGSSVGRRPRDWPSTERSSSIPTRSSGTAPWDWPRTARPPPTGPCCDGWRPSSPATPPGSPGRPRSLAARSSPLQRRRGRPARAGRHGAADGQAPAGGEGAHGPSAWAPDSMGAGSPRSGSRRRAAGGWSGSRGGAKRSRRRGRRRLGAEVLELAASAEDEYFVGGGPFRRERDSLAAKGSSWRPATHRSPQPAFGRPGWSATSPPVPGCPSSARRPASSAPPSSRISWHRPPLPLRWPRAMLRSARDEPRPAGHGSGSPTN